MFDLLLSMRRLSSELWLSEAKNVDDLHLNMVIRMLNAPHFNARMNALKQVSWCTSYK